MTIRVAKKYAILSVVTLVVGIVMITIAGLIYFYENATLKEDLIDVIYFFLKF